MPSVALERADIALFSDIEGTRIVLERLQQLSRAADFEQVTVRFDGDEYGTTLRGEGKAGTYPLVARFLHDEHAAAAALVALFETAQDAPDGRLMLRTHVGQVAGLDPLAVVTVAGFVATPVPDRIVDVSFTATRVAYTLEV